jgi:hypothetical protein
LQESVRNFSSVNRGRCRFFTTCTGSPSFHTNSRSSVVQPSAIQATSPFPDYAALQSSGNDEFCLVGHIHMLVSGHFGGRGHLQTLSPNSAGYLLLCRHLVWFILWSSCGDDTFFQNVSRLSTNYTEFYLIRLTVLIIEHFDS